MTCEQRGVVPHGQGKRPSKWCRLHSPVMAMETLRGYL